MRSKHPAKYPIKGVNLRKIVSILQKKSYIDREMMNADAFIDSF